MAIWSRVGRVFELSLARRSMWHSYGAGCYNDYYPAGDVCEYCATEEISADYYQGAENIELMGTGWDPD